MSMDDIIKWIWKPVTKEFMSSYEKAKKLDAKTLYAQFHNLKMGFYQYPGVSVNVLPSSGCPYRFRDGNLSGCSMCDYQSEYAGAQGALKALREKDAVLYARLIRESFDNLRSKKAVPNIIELLSMYDTFDTEEAPEELLTMLYDINDMYQRRPHKIAVESRANNITRNNVRKLKAKIPQYSRLAVEFGVEVGDDWVRNEWLNKDVTNVQIEKAVAAIHEEGCKAQCDVIIGIPGFTEQASIDLAVDTILYLDEIGLDQIEVLPLNLKKYTLQGFLHNYCKDDPKLMEVGIAQGAHTGLPWLFSVVEVVGTLYRKRPSLYGKIRFLQLSQNTNSIDNMLCYNHTRECECNAMILQTLSSHVSPEKFFEQEKYFKQDPCYPAYQELLRKQEGIKEMKAAARTVAKSVLEEMKRQGADCPVVAWF